MLKKIVNLDDVIEEIKTIGDMLVPFNMPQNDPELETDLHLLKSRILDIDGYKVMIHFSRADHVTHFIETVQIMGENYPFLPFCLVARLGKKFLGEHHLYLVEYLENNRKIYCWMVTLDQLGRPIPPAKKIKTEGCEYDGFEYRYMYANQANIY